MSKGINGIFFWLLCALPLFAQALDLKPDAPAVYVVQPGDTLINIAERYLNNPSDWPLLVETYPKRKNPYILYPGQVLTLNRHAHPSVSIRTGGTIKLSPQIRSSSLNKPIPVIPLSTIKPFLNNALVVNQAMLKMSPYIVGHENLHINSAAGDTVYVMNLHDAAPKELFSIFREGSAFRDPVTHQILGYKAIHVGFATLVKNGSPATFLLTETSREVDTGDKLQPASQGKASRDFIPTNPNTQVQGEIIDVLEGSTQISAHQIVVVNLGAMNEMKPGNILGIYQQGRKVQDPMTHKTVQLPTATVGQLMIFNVFDRVSYALVLLATDAIHVHDQVSNIREES